MATIVATDTESITTGFSESTLWSAPSPGIYTATALVTPTSGTGALVMFAAVGDSTVPCYGTGGYIDLSVDQDDPARFVQLGPWVDPTGDSLLVLAGDTIDGDTSIEWTVLRVANIT